MLRVIEIYAWGYSEYDIRLENIDIREVPVITIRLSRGITTRKVKVNGKYLKHIILEILPSSFLGRVHDN